MKIIIPATSANLGPGFDSLGLSLSFYNEVDIVKSSLQSISIRGEGENNNFLKKNNIFLNIFREIYFSLTGENSKFRIVCKNKIPFSRGLGSSSAIIVGAVASAYAMAGFEVNRNLILNKALKYEHHPDNIAPACFGGFVSSVVKNNSVFSVKNEISADINAVVVIPDVSMSTANSRNILPKKIDFRKAVSNISHSCFLTSCFVNKEYDLLKIACLDTLHEEIRMSNLPELFDIRKLAYENGALMSCLSGSGSSFLNIVYKDDAKRLVNKISDKFKNFKVLVLEFDNNGFELQS